MILMMWQVGPGDDYMLTVVGFNNTLSTLGDSMITNISSANLNGMKFSTKDKDKDEWSGNCAEDRTGGWWYNECALIHLTGIHTETRSTVGDEGIKQIYYKYGGERNNSSYDSWKEAEMMLVAAGSGLEARSGSDSGFPSQIHNFSLLFIFFSL